MKKYLFIAAGAAILFGCADTQKQEKDLLNQVIAVHDKVMPSDVKLTENKMLLDSLLKHGAPTINKDSAQAYIKLVDDADNAMNDWMHKFDPEKKDKSHQEFMEYLEAQKKQINKIDTLVTVAVNSSTKYITQIPVK